MVEETTMVAHYAATYFVQVEINLLEAKDIVLDYKADVDKVDFVKVEAYKEKILTKAFANELAEKNIQVNAIAPGYIETANTAPIRADESRNKEILGRIPAGKWGKPFDLMGSIVFLASKASALFTPVMRS